MSDNIVIKVEGLTKTYKLYNSPVDRLKESLLPFGKKLHRDFHALDNVSFVINKGETVGIIGKNGSGKSTLLKVLTGVLTPSSGTVKVNGRVSALLELGTGFNPELTGIENVYFNGMLMGHEREEMDKRLDDILSFADIGEFAHQPVKTYSSGMFVRLAFAVAINIEPQIIIIDEALSVGDIFFQQKCYTKLREILRGDTVCLFVSHDTAAISNICDRAILLESGSIVFEGAADEAVSRYIASVGQRRDVVFAHAAINTNTEIIKRRRELANSMISSSVKRHGAGGMTITGATVTDLLGRETTSVVMMDQLVFSMCIRANESIVDPSAGVQLNDRFGNIVFAAGTRQKGIRIPDLEPGAEIFVTLTLTFSVQPGEYTFSLGCAEPSSQGVNVGYVHDRVDNLGPIIVHAGNDSILPFHGIANLPLKIDISTLDNSCGE